MAQLVLDRDVPKWHGPQYTRLNSICWAALNAEAIFSGESLSAAEVTNKLLTTPAQGVQSATDSGGVVPAHPYHGSDAVAW